MSKEPMLLKRHWGESQIIKGDDEKSKQLKS